MPVNNIRQHGPRGLCIAWLSAVAALALCVAVSGMSGQPPVEASLEAEAPVIGSGPAVESAWLACSPQPVDGPAVELDAGHVLSSLALPSEVFVLDNTEVVLELPPDRLEGFYRDPVQASSGGSKVTITAAVLPSRLIVVDEADSIREVWSNTDGREYDFYSLGVVEKDVGGQAHVLIAGILDQYVRLADAVNWSERGRVYP